MCLGLGKMKALRVQLERMGRLMDLCILPSSVLLSPGGSVNPHNCPQFSARHEHLLHFPLLSLFMHKGSPAREQLQPQEGTSLIVFLPAVIWLLLPGTPASLPESSSSSLGPRLDAASVPKTSRLPLLKVLERFVE